LLKFCFLSSFTFPSILLRKKSVYIGCKSKIQLTKWCLTVVVVVVVFLRGDCWQKTKDLPVDSWINTINSWSERRSKRKKNEES
jgi:hypothetical protein